MSHVQIQMALMVNTMKKLLNKLYNEKFVELNMVLEKNKQLKEKIKELEDKVSDLINYSRCNNVITWCFYSKEKKYFVLANKLGSVGLARVNLQPHEVDLRKKNKPTP